MGLFLLACFRAKLEGPRGAERVATIPAVALPGLELADPPRGTSPCLRPVRPWQPPGPATATSAWTA